MSVRVLTSPANRAWLGAVCLLAISPPARAGAQSAAPASRVELRVLAGGFFPGGDLKSAIASSGLLTGQLAWAFRDRFAAVANVSATETFGDHTRFLVARRVNVYQYDLGVEGRLLTRTAMSWQHALALGVGFGGRAYDQKAAGVTSTNTAFYGALGLGLSKPEQPWGIRVELRMHSSAWRGLLNDQAKTNVSDFALGAGVSWHW